MAIIIVVDAFSTGRSVAEHLRRLRPNDQIWHVLSSATLPAALTRSFSGLPFDRDLGLFHSVEALQAEVAAANDTVEHVIAGADPGVELAERLAQVFGCSSRNEATSAAARFDKAQMHQRAPGWRTKTEEIRAGSPIHDVLSTFPKGARFIVKPPRSSATDGVRRCDTAQEAADHAKALLGNADLFGHPLDRVLVQQFIEGDEYCVNAVSVAGTHFFTDVWRYHKRLAKPPETEIGAAGASAPIYDFDDLIDPLGLSEADRALLHCASDVLTGVGIVFGASHTEIIRTDESTVLVETTPRLQGCINQAAFLAATGLDPTHLAALSYVDPLRVRQHDWEEAHSFFVARRTCALRRIHLIAPRRGRFSAARHIGFLKQTPTYAEASFGHRLADGAQADRTYDLMSSPGFFFLAGEPDALDRDYKRFREAEGDLYDAP